jgi:hypothetical protein
LTVCWTLTLYQFKRHLRHLLTSFRCFLVSLGPWPSNRRFECFLPSFRCKSIFILLIINDIHQGCCLSTLAAFWCVMLAGGCVLFWAADFYLFFI